MCNICLRRGVFHADSSANHEYVAMTMLEYCKLILEKVSFDPSLFRNELHKAASQLIGEELHELKQWCLEKFGQSYCRTAVPDFGF